MSQAANRMELLRVKKKQRLAQKGHSLLEKKRDALIREFFTHVQEYKRLSSDVSAQLQAAYEKLHIAEAVSGVNRVKSLAYSTNPSFKAITQTKNIMGVRIKQLDIQTQEVVQNASLIGISQYVIQAQKAFTTVVVRIVKLEEIKQTIYALAEEIKKTKRRVNALEHIHLPRLEHTKKTISDTLAEREREEFIRLKHVKKQLDDS